MDLCFGDIVFLQDCDTRYGRQYLKGSATLGVIVHSNCVKAGHGPGVTTLLTARDSLLSPVIDSEANIAHYLEIQK